MSSPDHRPRVPRVKKALSFTTEQQSSAKHILPLKHGHLVKGRLKTYLDFLHCRSRGFHGDSGPLLSVLISSGVKGESGAL